MVQPDFVHREAAPGERPAPRRTRAAPAIRPARVLALTRRERDVRHEGALVVRDASLSKRVLHVVAQARSAHPPHRRLLPTARAPRRAAGRRLPPPTTTRTARCPRQRGQPPRQAQGLASGGVLPMNRSVRCAPSTFAHRVPRGANARIAPAIRRSSVRTSSGKASATNRRRLRSRCAGTSSAILALPWRVRSDRARRRYQPAMSSSEYEAFAGLGFGATNTRLSPSRSGCSPKRNVVLFPSLGILEEPLVAGDAVEADHERRRLQQLLARQRCPRAEVGGAQARCAVARALHHVREADGAMLEQPCLVAGAAGRARQPGRSG